MASSLPYPITDLAGTWLESPKTKEEVARTIGLEGSGVGTRLTYAGTYDDWTMRDFYRRSKVVMFSRDTKADDLAAIRKKIKAKELAYPDWVYKTFEDKALKLTQWLRFTVDDGIPRGRPLTMKAAWYPGYLKVTGNNVEPVEEKPDILSNIKTRYPAITFPMTQVRYDLPGLDNYFKVDWVDGTDKTVLNQCDLNLPALVSYAYREKAMLDAFGELAARVFETMFDAVAGAAGEAAFLEKVAAALFKSFVADKLRDKQTEYLKILSKEFIGKVLDETIVQHLPLTETGAAIAGKITEGAADATTDAIAAAAKDKDLAEYMKTQTRYVLRVVEPRAGASDPKVTTSAIVDTIKGQAWFYLYVGKSKSCPPAILAGEMTNADGPALPKMDTRSFGKDTTLKVRKIQ